MAAVVDGPDETAGTTGLRPMQRLAQPSEMAEMVIWACSDKASYLTGAVLAVDGGMVAA